MQVSSGLFLGAAGAGGAYGELMEIDSDIVISGYDDGSNHGLSKEDHVLMYFDTDGRYVPVWRLDIHAVFRNPQGYDREGYDRQGYKPDDYGVDRDRNGNDHEGYNMKGYKPDIHGMMRNRWGYDEKGYMPDIHGVKRTMDGYDERGYKPDEHGVERTRDGYDRDGWKPCIVNGEVKQHNRAGFLKS
jgi:hypothetical protein